MRADADEAARKCAELNIVTPVTALLQGVARVLSGDLDGADAAFQQVMSTGEESAAAEDFAVALCERSLLAMARSDWSRAQVFADQARAILLRARREESFLTPLVCAVQARTALHRGEIPAARQELVSAQRMRHELTYALPHWAVQARTELAHASIALTDLAGARTLTREIDELLRHRPGLGTLVGEAEVLRAQLSKLRGPEAPGASALTAAELRLLPILATNLSFPQIAEQMSLSRHTVKAEAMSGPRRGIRPSCERGTSASSTSDRLAVGGLFRAPSDITWRHEEMPNAAATGPVHLRPGPEMEVPSARSPD
jgi:LuxR family maltose regulon positive regulatory protein